MDGQLGPLVGVLSSMEWILSNRKNYKWVMTFPCDTPFFKEDIVDQIKQKQSQSDKKLFFLKSGEKRHNIFGMWSVDLKDQLRKDLEAGDRKVEDWANKIGTEIIELDPKDDNSFLNINTKEDLEEASKKI
jgi:molybdopterin-guanine dinucleotide biosynthesis protein A